LIQGWITSGNVQSVAMKFWFRGISEMNFKETLERTVGCGPFWLPCWLAFKLGFEGLLCPFPCPVRKIFSDLLKI